jgi:hypothetical protein
MPYQGLIDRFGEEFQDFAAKCSQHEKNNLHKSRAALV